MGGDGVDFEIEGKIGIASTLRGKGASKIQCCKFNINIQFFTERNFEEILARQ